MLLRLAVTLVIFLHSSNIFANIDTIAVPVKFSVISGIGNYEYIYAGMKYTTNKWAYIEAAAGIKPWNFTREKYLMGYLSVGAPVTVQKHRAIIPIPQVKAILWNYSNDYNRFMMLGVAGELRLVYGLTNRCYLAASGGAIYNMLLKYERKTYLEVGWPKEWQPSFSIQLDYLLTK